LEEIPLESAQSRTPRNLTQNIGDADVSYLVYETDCPPLVFLHATGFMPWLWHPIARELAPPYRAIAPYFCDHRPSDPNNGGLGWRTMAQDFAALCKSLSLDRPFLVGHSMGATVLVLAEALFGLNARGMVLIEPIFLPEPFYSMDITVDQHPLAAKAIKRLNFWADREEALAYVQSRGLFKKWDKEVLDLYVQHGITPGDQGGLQLTCSPQREAALFMGGRQHNPWPEPAKITAPVLVVEGETSENRALIDLEKITSLFPQGSYRLIEGAGHLIPMEQPQVITEVIRDFFSTC
jgi:pimeloyl-ACP methyl ester carboxylesterase